LARQFQLIVEAQIARFDLCTRTEFEAQARVLERALVRVAELEARATVLEQGVLEQGALEQGALEQGQAKLGT
jgi:BMFP domain-containing protein YqiC